MLRQGQKWKMHGHFIAWADVPVRVGCQCPFDMPTYFGRYLVVACWIKS